MPQGKVFLVDDDASVRRALHRLIGSAGFEVESFPDARAYLARAAASPPACLVLDIQMPAMTGLELQSAIFGTDRDLPIVFLTGHGDVDVRAQAIESGAIDVLFKPVDEVALIAAIEAALAAWSGNLKGKG